MKLTSLKTVEVLNAKSLNLINGGLREQESNKKDVSSEEKDCLSGDHFSRI